MKGVGRERERVQRLEGGRGKEDNKLKANKFVMNYTATTNETVTV